MSSTWPIWQPKWHRVIGFIDFDAFFASVEQLDNPRLQHKPIAVTNGEQGSCIITCSYEARAFGIKTGMRLSEARRLCPHIQQCASRPTRYTYISTQVMTALSSISPEIEVFSIDEAFIDLTSVHHLYKTPLDLINAISDAVKTVIDLPVSIAIAGNKIFAKYITQVLKPNTRCAVPPWYNQVILERVPVSQLCGIGKKTAMFLAKHGVHTCGDMQKIPISILAKRFGSLGRRIWYMCQGHDPQSVDTRLRHAQSMSHSKVLPPQLSNQSIIINYFQDLCYRLATRMRCNGLLARYYRMGYHHVDLGWLVYDLDTITLKADGIYLFKLCRQQFIYTCPVGVVTQVMIVAISVKTIEQLDCFEQSTGEKSINQVLDKINHRYGSGTLKPLRLKQHDSISVISPAWQPKGPRQSIE